MSRPRVAVVPGVAVRRYAVPAAAALRATGIDTVLLPAPGQPDAASDLHAYARQVAPRLADGRLDALVGLSVGTQAAALLARALPAAPPGRLVLVGPTVDPAHRTLPRLLGRWARAGRDEPSSLFASQVGDWREAGPRRIAAVLRSALTVELERLLPDLPLPVSVVHAEHDAVTSHAYAAALAAEGGGRLHVVPGATHSWPYGDSVRFAHLVHELVCA